MDNFNLPQVKQVPMDADMARVIAIAISVADHESVLDVRDEHVARVLRVLRAAFPEKTT